MGTRRWTAVTRKARRAVACDGSDNAVGDFPDAVGVANKEISRAVDSDAKWNTQRCARSRSVVAGKASVPLPATLVTIPLVSLLTLDLLSAI